MTGLERTQRSIRGESTDRTPSFPILLAPACRLLGCGVDAYLEIDMGAGMDLSRLRQRYGTRVTFLGNMDCGRILSFSPPEEIARVTREILEAGGTVGGHIFTASNAITASVPLDHYMAMVNAYRDFFNLPRVMLDAVSAR
jgi:uroporphyrinogen-III decarboxylase